MKIMNVRLKANLIAIVLICSTPLSANAGVPVVFFSYPMMILALVPIILIEFFLISKKISADWRPVLKGVIWGNLASTLFGFPLAWFLLLGLEAATTGMSCGPGFDTPLKAVLTTLFEAAWLCPHDAQLSWLIPSAIFINLFLAYFISIFIEYQILKYFTRFPDTLLLKRMVWRANLISYLALSGLGIAFVKAIFKI